MDIALIGNTTLRSAIRRNLVSFPSQIPAFMPRQAGNTQKRIVQLYFVRGWKVGIICARYGLSKAMAQKLLSDWKIRAIAAGYIQEIDPDILETLARDSKMFQQDAGDESSPDFDFAIPAAAPMAPPQPDQTVSVAGGL